MTYQKIVEKQIQTHTIEACLRLVERLLNDIDFLRNHLRECVNAANGQETTIRSPEIQIIKDLYNDKAELASILEEETKKLPNESSDTRYEDDISWSW